MMDALGRFYSNINGVHEYTNPVMDVGVLKAWSENCFSEERFLKRGGIYDWVVENNGADVQEVVQ